MSTATVPNNARHQERLRKEDAIVESFRRKLREAYANRSCGEMNFRITFKDGGIREVRQGAEIRYEFVDESSPKQ